MLERLRKDLQNLMLLPGLSGYEGRVRSAIKSELLSANISSQTDRMGNLIATIEGDANVLSVMLFTHMDQLGFITKKIESDGTIRVERMGGVPERALASQAVLFCVAQFVMPKIFGTRKRDLNYGA